MLYEKFVQIYLVLQIFFSILVIYFLTASLKITNFNFLPQLTKKF